MYVGLSVTLSDIRSCEARIQAQREDQVQGKKTYKLIAVKDMSRVYGFSPQKVAAIIAKGNPVPDEDCPEVAAETRYWCLVDQERTDTATTRYLWLKW